MFYSKRVYQYQGNLFLIDSAYNPSNFDYYIIHQYNSKGQITNSKTFTQKARVLVAEISYEYKLQDELQLIKIQEKTDYSGKGRFENSTSIKYFDKNQNLVKEQNIGGTTYSVKPRELTYQLDATGNWVSNSKKETREIEYYETLPSVSKGTTAPANTGTTVSSVILDENFDNNNNKWTVWDNEGSGATFYKGYYRVTVKQSKNYLSWLNVPGLAADQSKDFAIETRAFLHTTERGNPNDSYWLLWGIGNNGKDYYAFGIYPDGRFQYGKLTGNSWNAMAGAMNSSAVDTGILKANILRVEKRKEEIHFFINGRKVHQAKYETFQKGYTGVGFQFNNRKLIDIDYLYIFQGLKDAAAATSPEPYESNYQKELSLANDSKSRAAALATYLNEVFVKTDSLNFSNLLAKKLQQMADIDFYAISEMLISNKGPNQAKIMKHTLNVIPADQRQIIIAYSNCIVDNFQRRQNSLPEQTCPPPHLPQPGFGLGKKVSSNKPGVAVVTNNSNVSPSPAKQYEPPADPLTDLKQRAKYLEGQTIYIALKKTCYYVPQKINITSLKDEVTLTAIGSQYTYSYSAGRNVFGTRSLSSITQQVKIADLVRGIDNVSGYYLVTELGPCGKCSGSGGSWNNSSRTRSYCEHCGATGCVPTYIWNNGSSRAF